MNRIPIPETIRKAIWQRDQGKCQDCGHMLSMETVYDHVELLKQNTLPIYSWVQSCWKCKQDTEIITYVITLDYDYHIGELHKFDNALMAACPQIKKIYSKTMEQEVVANVCVHCGTLQGNHYVEQEILAMKQDGTLGTAMRCEIPIQLELDDLSEQEQIQTAVRDGSLHIHHIDGNPANNHEDNMVLLCISCHRKRHGEG